MRIGAHESTAGGLHRALVRGEEDGCEAVQIFSAFNTRWAPRPLSDEEASLFRSTAAGLDWPLLAHASYLINLASPHPELHRRSIESLLLDLRNCETLGLDYLVLHPGCHMGEGAGRGLHRICSALGEIHRRTAGFSVRILLENTAGQGTCLGSTIDELRRILDGTWRGDRLGICIDTCHAVAAGHDLGSAEGYEGFFERLERQVGLGALCAFHLNDSMAERGSRRDRHTHVGEGTLGVDPFLSLVNDPRFADHPGVVETPPESDGSCSFARNIRRLKSLRGRGAGGSSRSKTRRRSARVSAQKRPWTEAKKSKMVVSPVR